VTFRLDPVASRLGRTDGWMDGGRDDGRRDGGTEGRRDGGRDGGKDTGRDGRRKEWAGNIVKREGGGGNGVRKNRSNLARARFHAKCTSCCEYLWIEGYVWESLHLISIQHPQRDGLIRSPCGPARDCKASNHSASAKRRRKEALCRRLHRCSFRWSVPRLSLSHSFAYGPTFQICCWRLGNHGRWQRGWGTHDVHRGHTQPSSILASRRPLTASSCTSLPKTSTTAPAPHPQNQNV
jgi:hypothetical protein